MKTTSTWNDKLTFTANFGNHQTVMDAMPPIGTDRGPSPKQLLLAAIAGCSGMDVVSLLRKGKQNFETFTIDTDATKAKGHPAIFERIDVTYRVQGAVDAEILKDAVHRSMTQYCGVSAMVCKASPIFYKVVLNDREIAEGQAKFDI